MSYTYDQVLTYEVARELINSHIADCSAEIADEQDKATPDQARIEQMQEKVTALVIERRQMDMTNDQAMKAVLAQYRREPMPRTTTASPN